MPRPQVGGAPQASPPLSASFAAPPRCVVRRQASCTSFWRLWELVKKILKKKQKSTPEIFQGNIMAFFDGMFAVAGSKFTAENTWIENMIITKLMECSRLWDQRSQQKKIHVH